MPYRRDASTMDEPAAVAADGSLVSLDVSGRHGRPGAHGHAGADGSWAGGDGARGGDASPAEIGESAGRLHVHLRSHPSLDERLVLQADAVLPSGERRRVDRDIAFREGGFLDLAARGGRGGDGGHGGRGGDGATGSRGSNATRYSSGGNGGRGGDGGDGGNGSSGASGGSGGRIEVEVDAHDTHLLMLLRPDVRGGEGGRAGQNGAGGSGGAGGEGGSSYSWTETESYTDSQGKPAKRTTHHSNPGGMSGSSGSSGSPGRAALHPGAAGPPGRFEIVVRDASGHAQRYADRYRLRLVSFEHVNENEDGIYEPGERVEVRTIRVANVGGMPTPASRDVRVVLDPEGWVWPEDGHVVVPPSLPAGELAEVPGSLFFRIGEHTPDGPSDPLCVEDYIQQTAFIPDVNRAFEAYQSDRDAGGRYVVRYPIELSVIESLPSVAPGEAARIRFAVRNVSRRAFGSRSSLGRVVRLHLHVHGAELELRHLALFDEREGPIDVARGWVIDVDRLEPGEVRTFEGTVGMAPDAPFFCAVTFWLSLELGRIDAPDVPRAIQHRDFTMRVARRYVPPPELDLLLVVGPTTTREEVESWERLAARLGLATTTWDPSIEGHLDPLRDDGRGPFVEHLRGGTLVVIDAPMPTPIGAVAPHRLLDRARLGSLVEAGIATLVMGGADLDLERWLVPDDASMPTAKHADAARFLEALVARRDTDDVHASLDVHHLGFWFEPPTEARLSVRATRLSARLLEALPHRRFVIACELAPEVVSSAGVVKRWRMGALRVRATLDSARSHVVHVASPLGGVRIVDADPRITEIVLLARSFDEKLTRLAEAVRDGRDASAEVRAILVDLASEAAAVLSVGWRRGLSSSALARALPLLHRAIERAPELGAPMPDAPAALAPIELLARLRYFVRVQPRFWEWPLWPLRRATRLRHVVTGLVDRWIEALFGLRSTEAELWAEATATRVADARRRVLARERELAKEPRPEGVDARAHAHHLTRHPLDWQGLTSDAELLGDPASRVIEPARLGAIRAADDADRTLRDAVQRALQTERSSMSRPWPSHDESASVAPR